MWQRTILTQKNISCTNCIFSEPRAAHEQSIGTATKTCAAIHYFTTPARLQDMPLPLPAATATGAAGDSWGRRPPPILRAAQEHQRRRWRRRHGDPDEPKPGGRGSAPPAWSSSIPAAAADPHLRSLPRAFRVDIRLPHCPATPSPSAASRRPSAARLLQECSAKCLKGKRKRESKEGRTRLWAEWFNLELDHDIEIRNRFTLDPPFVAHSDFHPHCEKPGYNAFSNLQNQCKQDLHPTWRLHDRSIQKIKREKLNTKKIKKYMSSPYVSQKKKVGLTCPPSHPPTSIFSLHRWACAERDEAGRPARLGPRCCRW